MKYILYFHVMLTCISCSSIKGIAEQVDNAQTLFMIKKIESNDLIYVITAQRNDSIFQIISPKDTVPYCDNIQTIKQKEKYSLILNRIYSAYSDSLHVNSDVGGKSCFLSVNKRCHYSLYMAENLSGLHLAPNGHMGDIYIKPIICDACNKRNKLLIFYIK